MGSEVLSGGAASELMLDNFAFAASRGLIRILFHDDTIIRCPHYCGQIDFKSSNSRIRFNRIYRQTRWGERRTFVFSSSDFRGLGYYLLEINSLESEFYHFIRVRESEQDSPT